MKKDNILTGSIVILLILFISISLKAQDETQRQNALKVYIDCGFCDFTHIKQEILFINYVRDPQQAQVYILGTVLSTGSGGNKYEFKFRGRNEFEGMNDTLYFISNPNNTEAEIRSGYTNILKIGLIRYAAKTPLVSNLRIEYKDTTAKIPVEVKDKWDSWVFNLGMNSSINGEDTYKYVYLNSYVSASRVTEDMKIGFSAGNSYSESKTKISDDGTISSFSRSYYFTHGIGWSLSNHWSAGYSINSNSSTYSNYKFLTGLYSGLEYNIFPYSEYSSKVFKFIYKLGYEYRFYYDSTIYNKINEGIFQHILKANFVYKEEWGSVSVTTSATEMLNNLKMYVLESWGSVSLRIYEGLSFNLWGYVSIPRNQINLRKDNITYEETLLRQRQIASEYYYQGGLGLSYTFGSIYNNIVNPRFDD